jgi:hypothetical protein
MENNWFQNPWATNQWMPGGAEFEKWASPISNLESANTDNETQNNSEGEGSNLKINTQNGSITYYKNNLYEGGVTKQDLYKGSDDFAIAVKNALNKLQNSKTAQGIINTLQKAPENVYVIYPTNESESSRGSSQNATMCYWKYKNPEAVPTENGKTANAAINLIHELGHAYRYEIGEQQKAEGKYISKEGQYVGEDPNDFIKLKVEEEEASHLENKVRAEMKRPLRTSYELTIVKNGKRLYGVQEKNWDYRTKAKSGK